MPIDLLQRKKDLEQGSVGLLSNQYTGIPDQNQSMLDSISKARSGFIGQLNLPKELIAMKQPTLDRRASGVVANLGYARQNDSLQKRFEEYFRQAQDAGLDVQSANDYARKQVSLRQEQDFSASQSELDRQNQLKLFGMKSEYADQGLQLQNSYQDQALADDRSSALARLLAGSVASIGSAYYLNRPKIPKTKTTAGTPGSPAPADYE